MIPKIKRFFQNFIISLKTEGSFGRNLTITAFGNGFSYTVGLLLTPIITRIYEPQAYGEFALFNTFVASISLLATLNYESAFLLSKSKTELSHLLKLTLFWVAVVSGLSFLGFILWSEFIFSAFGAKDIIEWAYLIPVAVFIIGVNRCLEFFNVQQKRFSNNAKSKMTTIISSKVMAVGAGLATKGHMIGLVLGELLSKPLGTVLMYGKSIKSHVQIKSTLSDLQQVARSYRNYPRFVLPANLLQSLSKQLPIYLLSFYFGSQITGWFSLANTTLNLPIMLMGTSAAYVFYQKAAETHQQNPQNLGQITKRLFSSLSVLGIVPFSVLFIFGDILFKIILGNNWETAGKLAGYLSVYGYMQFISLSIGSLFRILRQERLQFQINLVGAVVLTAVLFLVLAFNDHFALVIVFSGVGALIELGIIAIAFFKIGLNPWYVIKRTLGYFLVATAALYLIRWWLF